jgi:iron complex outermembrane receptor protein
LAARQGYLMILSNSLFRSFLSFSLALSISSISYNAYSNELVIDEVIVTAEKRVESLQDVSKAVTALSSDEIERKKHS